ncbi:MAG: hypothetical protein CMJ88_04640 [Planctomycetes bacterium]|nr:hypothetical protein [Planctomycetota bacterium]
MKRPARCWATLSILCLGACSVPETVERLGDANPTPALGRPAWVRAAATTGATVGGAAGTVVSVALLPVTWPISLLCSDRITDSARSELLWFPATELAAIGHAALGAPADAADYTFRRAWTNGEASGDESAFAPLPSAELPRPAAAAATNEGDG